MPEIRGELTECQCGIPAVIAAHRLDHAQDGNFIAIAQADIRICDIRCSSVVLHDHAVDIHQPALCNLLGIAGFQRGSPAKGRSVQRRFQTVLSISQLDIGIKCRRLGISQRVLRIERTKVVVDRHMNGDLTRFRQTIRGFVIIGVCGSDLACGGIIRDIRRSRILLQQRIGLVACRDELFPARIGISALLCSGEHGVQLSDIRSGIVRAFQIVLVDKTAQCRPDRRECGRKRFVCDRILRLTFVQPVRAPVPCARCDGSGFSVRLIQSIQQRMSAGHRVLKRLPARSRIICLLQWKLRFDIVALFCLGVVTQELIKLGRIDFRFGNQLFYCRFERCISAVNVVLRC